MPTKSLQELISSCPKCCYLFTERKAPESPNSCHFPIILHCGHTLCTSCIEASCEESFSVACAECCESHPRKPPDYLPDYYALGIAVDLDASQQAHMFVAEDPDPIEEVPKEPKKNAQSLEFHRACRLYKKLRVGRRNINKAVANNRANLSVLMENVTKEFHHLHSLLELRKKELTEKINELHGEEIRHLMNVHSEASQLIDEMDKVVFKEQKDDGKVPEESDKVLEKAKSFKWPTSLMGDETKGIAAPQITVKFDDGLTDVIKNIGKVLKPVDPVSDESCERVVSILPETATDLSQHCTKQMESGTEIKNKEQANNEEITLTENDHPLDERVEVNMSPVLTSELPEVFINSETLTSANLPSEQHGTCKDVALRNEQPKTIHEENDSSCGITSPRHKASLQLCMLSECMVCVSHVQDPGMFWVHIWSDIPMLKEMETEINRWCKSPEAKDDIPVTVKMGGIYLALSSRDNKWHRVRVQVLHSVRSGSPIHSQVMKIHTVASQGNLDSDDDSTDKETEEGQAEVSFLDWGNRALIPVSKLRNIKDSFLVLPFMAKQCSLYDIVPANEAHTWTPQATEVFIKFTGKNKLLMLVREQSGNVLHVDLCQPASNDIHNDVPSSVRDALVFLELGYFPSNYSDGSIKPVIRQFPKAEQLQKGESYEVVLTEAESPGLFYVQKVGESSRILSSMFFEMQDVYGKEPPTLPTIYCPKIGTACVAQYSADKQWYRAIVLGLPGGALVEVFYVDFGNKEKLPYWQLRKISDHFLSFPIQAFKCKLATVAPLDGIKWSTEAKNAFLHLASKKQLSMKVQDGSTEQAEVSLFEMKDGLEVNIAELLIKLHHACQDIKEVEINAANVPAANLFTAVKTKHSSLSKNDPMLVILEKFRESESNKGKDTSKSLAIFPVIVCYVESPSMFFIQLLTPQIKSLFEHKNAELQKAYKNSKPGSEEWEVDSLCAFLDSTDKTWYRGIIKNIENKENVKVFYLDYGCVETVPKCSLRLLMETFQFKPLAIRCHLSGIVPAGGGKGWTRVANEYLREDALANNNVFVIVKGDLEEDSLPVDLLVEVLKGGGALEPRMIQHLSITQQLLDRGLALPKGRGRITLSISEISPLLKSKHRDLFPQAKIPRNSKQNRYNLTSFAKTLWSPYELKSNKKTNGKQLMTIAQSLIQTTSASNLRTELSKQSKAAAKTVRINPLDEIININACPLLKGRSSIQSQSQYLQWKQPVLPDSLVFCGVPTHVDHDGYIYFHVFDPGSKIIGIIRNTIMKKQTAGGLHSVKNILRVGQACIAKFWYDECWYRAQVLRNLHGSGQNNFCEVFFVDYGNKEVVPMSDVSVDLVMEDVPKQCIKAQLYGIQPVSGDGRWPSKVLDFLQDMLVDKTCNISLVNKARNNIEIILILPSGVPLAKLLVEKNMAFDLEQQKEAKSDFVTRSFKASSSLDEYVSDQSWDNNVIPNSSLSLNIDSSIVSKSKFDSVATSSKMPGDYVSPEFRDIPEVQLDSDTLVTSLKMPGDYVSPEHRNILKAQLDSDTLAISLKIPEDYECSEFCDIPEQMHGDSLVTSFKPPKDHMTPELCDAINLPSDQSSNISELLVSKDTKTGESSPCKVGSPPIAHSVSNVTLDDDDKAACKNGCSKHSQFTEISSFEVGQTFLAVVTNVIQADLIHVQQMRTLSPVNTFEEEINKRFDSFIEMTSQMRDNVDSFSALTNPKVGMAVCGRYTFDDTWYRCEITEIMDEGISVKFVDYGNTEVLPLDRLRMLPNEYLSCATLAILCKIHGIFPVKGTWDNRDTLLMGNLLCSGETVWVRIEELHPLQVSLYAKDPKKDRETEVIYKKYADQGIILWIDDYVDYEG